MEAVECGAAALSMVLAFHGKWIPLEHVRANCGVSRDGSDAFKMVTAAKHYGLRVKALRKEPEQLAQLPLPQILYWEFDHFVVLTGVEANKFFLNDPALGERVLTAEEFSKGFTGLTLCFAPAPGFQPSGEKPSIWKSLRKRLRGLESDFALMIGVNLALTIPGLLMTGLGRVFVDDYLVGEQHEWLWAILLALFLGAGLSFLISFLQQTLLIRLQSQLAVAESVAYVWRILQMPFLFFSQRSAGELVQRARLNNQIANALTGPLAEIYLSVCNVAIYLLLMAMYDWVVASAALTAITGLIYLFSVLNGWVQRQHQQLQLLEGQAYGISVHGLDQFETYSAQGAESLFFERWFGAESAVIAAEQRTAMIDNILDVAPTIVRGGMLTLILFLSALRAMEGDISFGGLVSLQLLSGLLLSPINVLLRNNSELQETAGALLRLDDLYNYPQESPESEQTLRDTELPAEFIGEIQVRELSFGYQPGTLVLNKLCLQIEPGKVTGIVGKSGSGKSTLAKCLIGLLKPTGGSIEVDGIELSHWPAALRKSLIAYVEQRGSLMTGSLKENLSMWQQDVTTQQIIRAAERAAIHTSVTNKPGGYRTGISGRDNPFSGGETQRLTIARALASSPQILILDEATSALDNLSEAAVLNALKALGITVVLVTHRPSSVAYCDNLVYLESGVIAQSGERDEVLSQAGPIQEILKESGKGEI